MAFGRDGAPTGSDGEDDPVDEVALREAAVRLLARREHSRRELVRKLVQKGWPDDAVQPVVDALESDGLQSDQRFAESFVRQRVGKGYGPLRIRAELAERGIDRADAGRALDAEAPDWREVAGRWYEVRYGAEPPSDLKDASRRQQALSRRGFAHEHFRDLFDR
ncbi:regulatory protein RecX [Halomonas denitrificans]|nr:recombination regulator RecX [Halomonas denitrificans]